MSDIPPEAPRVRNSRDAGTGRCEAPVKRIAPLLVVALGGCFGPPAPPSTAPTPPPKVPTVVEYTQAEIAATNQRLATGVLAKFTEDMHPGVTYREATLTSLRLTTIDGTNSAGIDGNNISEVHAVFVVKWQGPITQDGFTEVALVYDRPAKLIKDTKYLRSNAAINLNAIDWEAVGVTLVQAALPRGLR